MTSWLPRLRSDSVCCWALFGVACLVQLATAADPKMQLHVIDVGQANASILEFPCGAILIDAGAQDDEYTLKLLKFVKAFFDRRTDLHNTFEAMIISHPHIDHTLAIEPVLKSFRIKHYIDNGITRGSGKVGVNYARQHAQEFNFKVREIPDDEIVALPQKTGLTDEAIDSIKCADCDPQIRILSGGLAENPGWSDGDFDNLNNHSVVVRIDFGESSFLFGGDLEEPAIESLVEYYDGTNLLDVDITHINHHGSANGLTPSYLSAATPDIALMGVGQWTFGKGRRRGFNTFSYGHPRRTIVDLLSAAIPGERNPAVDVQVADAARKFSGYHVTQRIYATAWDGNITITAGLDGAMSIATGSVEDVPLLAPAPVNRNAATVAARARALSIPAAAAPAPSPAPSAQDRYRWNLTIPEKRPANGGNGKVVLFDVSHGGTAGQSDWVIDGGFSDFADALVAVGYTVREYRGVDKDGDGVIRFFDDRRHELAAQNEAIIEFGAIQDAAVFVMAETNRPLRKDERAALLQFVDSGKGIYFIADHYNADRNLNSWDATEVFNGYNRSTAPQFDLGGFYGDQRNPGETTKGWLVENFGLRFRFNAIDCKDGASDVVAAADAEQLTAGVGPVLMAASSTLAIVNPAKAKGIVYLRESDRARGWSGAVEGGNRGLYFGGRKEGPLVAISKPGKGKAAFIGDSSPIEDSSPKYSNEMTGRKKTLHNGWNDAGNAAKLSVNIIDWLAKTEDYVGFNGANGHAAGTATPDPFALVEQSDPDDGQPWSQPQGGYDPWNTDTFAPGSYGAPLPLHSPGAGGGGGGVGGNVPPAPAGTLTVPQALQASDGKIVAVEGIIQGEWNDQYGLKLADSTESAMFLAVQVPTSLRAAFSPHLAPGVKGKKVRITGKRGAYTSRPGLREVTEIVFVN